MAWIESHQELARHPKTRRLARLLAVSVPTVIGHLHLLWWWALDYAEDGDLSQYEDPEIADAALWEGDHAAFLQALRTAGFIDDNGSIHDWDEYAGKLVERRRIDRDRKRTARAAIPLIKETSVGRPTDGAPTAYVPYPTQPDPTGPEIPLLSHESNGAPAVARSVPVGDLLDDLLNKCADPLVKNKNGVVIDAAHVMFGDDYDLNGQGGRIGKLAGEVGGQMELIRRIFKHGSEWVSAGRRGDPLDYVTKIVHNGTKANSRTPQPEPLYADSPEYKEKQARELAELAADRERRRLPDGRLGPPLGPPRALRAVQ